VVIEGMVVWRVTAVYLYVCFVCRGKLFVVIEGMAVWRVTGVYLFVCCVCRGNFLLLLREWEFGG
jgi:hypothetical protein